MSTTQQRPSAWVLIGALVLLPTALFAGDSADAVESFHDAYRSGDAAAMLAAYTEDAVFEDVNQRHRFAGAEQLRAFLGSLAHLHQEMDIVVDRSSRSGFQSRKLRHASSAQVDES